MSFLTALNLSLTNLMTKKGRTLLTAFAGSIGIIGIALILSISNGVDKYIERVQRDTLSAYPLEINDRSMDMTETMTAMFDVENSQSTVHEEGKVYTGTRFTDSMSSLMSGVKENDLASFKLWLVDPANGIEKLVSGIQYEYETPLIVYRTDGGKQIKVNPPTTMDAAGMTDMMSFGSTGGGIQQTMMDAFMKRLNVFEPLLDNEELLKATAESLRKWYKVMKARDGQEALDLLKYQEVDVIVSDVMMPRMDGNELCRRLKNDLATSHLPVILLTAKVSVEAKVEGMESGADLYLEKPFSIRQLHLQIESLLRLRQQFYERMRSIDSFMVPQQESKDTPLGLSQQDLLFIEHLQKSVEENMQDEEFSIDTLAEQLHMSRSSFYRKIKALTDMTPTDYLKTARMNRAARLLKEGCRSSEVAERVGFTSSSYFAKCFRAQFGCLPKDYAAQ
jgi:DNA-binding response OmpR family regulator